MKVLKNEELTSLRIVYYDGNFLSDEWFEENVGFVNYKTVSDLLTTVPRESTVFLLQTTHLL
jgi:hypothetical protein